MSDFRVDASWRTHPKRRKLLRRVGPGGVLALEDLWSFCSESRTDGRLTNLELEDLELIVEDARPECGIGELVDLLLDLQLLDRVGDGGLQIHDWADWQPFVSGASQRTDSARANALTRWHNDGKHGSPVDGCPLCDATRMRPQCDPHATAVRPACDGNAPTPTPTPTPKPTGSANRNALPGRIGHLAGYSGSRTVEFEAIDEAVRNDWPSKRRFGTDGVPSKWRKGLRDASPFSPAEVKGALEATLRVPRPNAGLLSSWLLRVRGAGNGSRPPIAPVRQKRVEEPRHDRAIAKLCAGLVQQLDLGLALEATG